MSYKEWFEYFFGKKLYELMAKEYTSKIWKIDPAYISADWANQRFQQVNVLKLVNITLKKIKKSNEIFEEEKIIYILSSYGFYYLEVDKMYHGKFVGNINLYNTIAGPKDVDLDYFPTWIGKKRVVATSGNTMKYLIGFSEKKFDYYLWEKNN